MRYLVAYSPGDGGRETLGLARVLASTGDVTLVVAVVVPETWGYPSLARVDAEYAGFLAEHAESALRAARDLLAGSAPAEYVTRNASSAADGILDLAEELDAGLVVVGSSRAGPLGRFTAGSVSDTLLHASPVPVALAPRGYRPSPGTRLARVSCGFGGAPGATATVRAATALARRHGVPLRLVTFVVRDRQMYPSLVGWESERMVEEQWRVQAAKAQEQALAALPDDVAATAVVADGYDWHEALDRVPWEDGEVLVAGSSRLRSGSRIFLGSNATKILRASPVPTVVVPGAT
jgi:nucleotide-binding universal stress UspA family protein